MITNIEPLKENSESPLAFMKIAKRKFNDIIGIFNGNAKGSYKSYQAFLTQTGTNAPVATVFKNQLGGDIVFTYDSTGAYTGTLTGAFPNHATKCFILFSGNEYNVSAANNIMLVLGADFNDDNSFFISTGLEDATGSRDVANGELHNLIEIRVYS